MSIQAQIVPRGTDDVAVQAHPWVEHSLDIIGRNSYLVSMNLEEAMKSIVSEKGQITIPHRIRKHMGITPGTVIEFEERDGLLIGKKQPPAVDVVARVTGILREQQGIDEYLAESRDPTT